MFGRKRHMNKKVMFLLQMNCKNHPWSIPEDTLWLSFHEALVTALTAIAKAETEGEVTINWNEFEFNENESAYLPECFEILPISTSTVEHITWWGKEVKSKEDIGIE